MSDQALAAEIPDGAETAWHYSEGPDGSLYDGSPVPRVGERHSVEGEVVLQENAMHACPDPWDALQYAPGAWLERVRVWGDVREEGDKVAGRHRVVVERWDLEDDLRIYARGVALDAVLRYYPRERAEAWGVSGEWDAMTEWLWTGEGDRAAARAAAGAAAWAAGRAADWDAASAAAGDAAWAAARDAARNAASAAARTAAWAAAGDAAWAAARDAARAASRDRYRAWYHEMIADVTGVPLGGDD